VGSGEVARAEAGGGDDGFAGYVWRRLGHCVCFYMG
jgi:hypothetical protein